ncbi:hypothetical protein HOLleu_23269 [Holothuria leucospilota]|uniref:WSC domain-containing protein n=1 Tax=Holothuria leucospilota TaxID=206669 RepID=A0A9Q1BUY5_HOLLE|nr:hypothetical protein HOLleu_23269 [Holothuria leucospilota]
MLSREVYTDPLLTPQRCSSRCERQPRSYFMLRKGKICACFEDVLDMTKYETSDACYLLCKGDTLKTCGGNYAVEIYKAHYCPRLQQPANGHVMQNLSAAWFRCLEGYRLEGPNVIFCDTSTRQWN